MEAIAAILREVVVCAILVHPRVTVLSLWQDPNTKQPADTTTLVSTSTQGTQMDV